MAFPDGKPTEGSKQQIVIFGAGGFARLAHAYFQHDSDYEVVGFTVHQKYQEESELSALPVLPFERLVEHFPPGKFGMFVAIGYERVNKARAEVYRICKDKGYDMVSYISSKTTYWEPLSLGDNCFIYEHNAIHPSVRIGNNVIIGSGNHIGHDTIIGDHCFLAGHCMIPGYVTVGDYSFIGANVTLKDGISIAPECILGAGSLILKDTQPQEVYVAEGTRPTKVTSTVMGELMHSPFFRPETKS